MAKVNKAQRQQLARERAEARLTAARRARARRRMLLALASVGVVVVVVATFVVVKLTSNSSASASGSSLPTGTARARILAEVTGVPTSTLDAVGQGAAAGVPARIKDGVPLTAGGKPELLYVGAEWCPFCAAERWAMVVALDRFGTFSNLGLTHSASNDTFPNTSTLSFHGSTYTSQYLTFSAVETQDNNHKQLDTPTQDEQKTMTTYDSPPFVDASSAGAIPFVDFGNKFVVSGSSYSPKVLAGKSWSQIASALADPSNPIAKNIDGAANTLTAAICTLTKNQPAAVCTGNAVAQLITKL
ncbi:MAG TPA: DUF929 family protein [Mycobacteriales bacterium]|nr:DUF929 family protein [Mycobacteriales bacterium]